MGGAYKINKYVNFWSLYFSTLEQREHFCHEELRLNRRFAPQLYLDMVAIRGSPQQPRFDGVDPVIEYNEVAFLMMNLQARRQAAYAWRFINSYLEHSGDYAGIPLLRLYLTYRAVVRAKVAHLQTSPEALADYRHYMALAHSYTQPAQPYLVIMQGVSGSGKSTLSQPLADQLEMIRVRSDVESKRMFALDLEMYTITATDRAYRHLTKLAGSLLTSGYNTVLDATGLRRTQRDVMRDLARRLRVPFIILRCHAPRNFLEHALAQRAHAGGDASDANLQVYSDKSLRKSLWMERKSQTPSSVDASVKIDTSALALRLRSRLDRRS